MSGNNKYPISKPGLERVEKELHDLMFTERKRIAEEIKQARELGDLSENHEYKAAKEEQGAIEGRIAELETIVATAEVVPKPEHNNKVQFGSTVKIVDEETEEETVYTIVSEYESNIKEGLISIKSPIARALINRSVEDSIEIQTPRGMKYMYIEKIGE